MHESKDDVIEYDLYEGTAKSMEGMLADEWYKQAKDEGCDIVVVWQDGDSSSQKSVEKHHGKGSVQSWWSCWTCTYKQSARGCKTETVF